MTLNNVERIEEIYRELIFVVKYAIAKYTNRKRRKRREQTTFGLNWISKLRTQVSVHNHNENYTDL